MFNSTDFTSRELAVRDSITLALGSSLSLPKVLENSQSPILELLQADSYAVCVMSVAPSLGFRWHVPGPRLPILDRYAELIEHDFLREPILTRPGVPVCDTQLLSRREYERTLIYQRSVDLEPRLEHIMAVLVPIRPGRVGALAFYRHEKTPFSAKSITALSSLTQHLSHTLGNCQDYQDRFVGAQVLQSLYQRKDSAFIVVEPPAHEVVRSTHATALLERWFAPSDFHPFGLPRVLQEQLDALVRMDPGSRPGKTLWVMNHPDGYRTCRFIELPADEGPRHWALLLNEFPHSIPLPLHMQQALTARELDVARGVLRNWCNGQIADDLEISGETVKTHVRNIFDKLGVDGRADFLYQVSHLNRPV